MADVGFLFDKFSRLSFIFFVSLGLFIIWSTCAVIRVRIFIVFSPFLNFIF